MICLNKHSISASIAERYAYICYELAFENLNEKGSNELRFEITIHPQAFISGFTADIDGELFKGKTKEKKEAKQEYEAAKKKSENAILISQPHENIPNVFQISTNIDAKSKILLNIQIEQYLTKQFNFNQLNIELLKEFDTYSITKKYDYISFQFDVSDRNGIYEIDIPSNEENMFIKDKIVKKLNENQIQITGKIMDKSSINELILKYKVTNDKKESNILFDKKTHTFCHIISDLISNKCEEKTEGINTNILIPRRVVIVIDRSGSMSGIKWDKTISATITALKQLRCGYDRYCVILCGNSLILHPKQQMTVTDNDNIQKCITILEKQRAEGCELINDALLKSIELIKNDIKLLNENKDIKYNYYQNQIILLTDGEPTIGETNTDKIVENVKNANNLKGIDKYSSKICVHSFGIGSDRNDGSWTRDLNHNFLKLLSINNYGIYQRIKQTRTDKLLNEYFNILSKPILTNIQIKYTDTNCTDLTKTSFNTLFDGNDIIICGKLHNIKTLNMTVNISAITGQQITENNGKLVVKPIEINKSIKVKLNAYETNDDQKSDDKIINRIWAYLKLKQFSEKRLMDNDMIEFDEDDDKIPLSLAMKYHFISPWTSMIVVKKKDNKQPMFIQKPKQNNIIDPSADSELAMAIRMSMDEERGRHKSSTLFRLCSATQWNEDRLDEMQELMKQEMQMLMTQQINVIDDIKQETEDATVALISQMMSVELCCMCKKNQGFELECGDNLCGSCAKKYILSGIASMRWNKEALVCSACNKGIIPDYILKECGLGNGMKKKLEEMQMKFMIDNDPSIISCPKCKEVYSIENINVLNNINESDEMGPNGKLLSDEHKIHKAKYRFKCRNNECKIIFCSGCYSIPYHIGYGCDEFKQKNNT